MKNSFQEYCKTNTYIKKNFAYEIGNSALSVLSPVYFNLHFCGQSSLDLGNFAGVPTNTNLYLPSLVLRKGMRTQKTPHLYINPYTPPSSVSILLLSAMIHQNPSSEMASHGPSGVSLPWHCHPQLQSLRGVPALVWVAHRPIRVSIPPSTQRVSCSKSAPPDPSSCRCPSKIFLSSSTVGFWVRPKF